MATRALPSTSSSSPTRNRRVVVFGASGEVVRTMRDGHFKGVTVHGDTVVAHDCESFTCVVFT
jgi:hypothetical protein